MLTGLALALMAGMGAACGDDKESVDKGSDERISQLAGLAAAATYAYAATDGEGLMDYVAANIAENCTKEEVIKALGDEPVPIGFKSIKDVQFDVARATATVVVMTRDGEEEQEWRFIREGAESWRIEQLASLSVEDCGAE